MSIRRMMFFTLGAKIKNLIQAFKARVLTDFGQFEAESCLEAQLTQLDNQSLLDNASLIVTPNAYKETLLYSVVPSDATGDMSVTRATRATRVNSDGLIENVPYNLFNRSEEFENTYWTKQRTSITPNAIMAPNGTMSADSLVGVSGNTYAFTGTLGVNVVSTSFVARNECTVFFYLKYNGLNRIRVMYGGATSMSGGRYVEVDLQLGIITDTGVNITNPFIEDVGDGWYSVGFTSNMGVSATNNRFGVGLGDTVKTIADGVDGVYVWGAQLVDGDLAKEYLPVSTGFNIPRIDYSNASCPSILVEPQRTNLVLQSENFLATNWTIINSNVTATVELSPSGLENTNKLTADGTSGFHYIFHSNISFTIGTTYTYTVFAKKDTNNFIQLWVNGAIGGMFANFDLNNGVTGTLGTLTGNLPTSKITNVGNGWYRCEMVFVSTTTNSTNFSIFIVNSANATRTQNNTLTTSVFLWGAQLEVGTNATSYIPTTTAAVTRNADVIRNTNASTLIGQSEGTLFADVYITSFSNTGVFLSTAINETTVRIELYKFTNGKIYFDIVGNTGSLAGVASTSTFTNNVRLKIALAYKSGDTVMFINGNQETTVITNTYNITGQNRVGLGQNRSNGNFFNDFINNVALFKTRLTNTQLQNLTTL
jgi:hypothetical protein